MKIIIDAMGGDNAPSEIVKGAVMAAEEFGVGIILVGKTEEILKCIKAQGHDELPRGIEIANATETIEMDDDPASAFRRKKDSSMTVALNMLRDGNGDAMVSAGSTGALLSAATLIVKRIKGIRRAALAPFIPNKGNGVMIIDCGANAECTPEYLLQFAYMGSCYVENVIGIKNPRVGLLNNGTERTKGTSLQVAVYDMLEEAGNSGRINFVGNIEAKGVMKGECDVVVCDGYSGNILLKSIEGTSSFLLSELKSIFMKDIRSKIGALLLKKYVYELKDKMDVDKVGGTVLLGISKPVIKAHGSSNAMAICSAVRQAINTVNGGVIDKINAHIDFMKLEKPEI